MTQKKASATETRYIKLKEKHSELINTHAELLRKNADTAKQLTVTQQSQEEVARVKEQLAFQMEQVKRESEMKIMHLNKGSPESIRGTRVTKLEKLKRELEGRKQENWSVSRRQLSHKEQESLCSTVRQREAELQSAQSLVQEKEAALSREQERSSREIGELQGEAGREGNPCLFYPVRVLDPESGSDLRRLSSRGLQQRLLDEQLSVLQGAVAEAENTMRDAVSKLDDPPAPALYQPLQSTVNWVPTMERQLLEGSTGLARPGVVMMGRSVSYYLVNRAQAALDALSALEKGQMKYMASMTALAQFSHLAADTIINGSATSHLAPTDHADRLTDTCRECGAQSLEYLGLLKDRQSLKQADPSRMRGPLQGILQLGQELKPKSLDVRQEELGDLVDKEMAATSAAIENAVRRIEDMMNQARHESSGVKLEVNERILNSCTDLMKAIRLLVMTSTSLQKEIVESGRGAATQQEFYAKNSRWTEGLISASKAVGWGATQLVESADKVVLHTGKYEELIVCSHEIAASTAQLVAASSLGFHSIASASLAGGDGSCLMGPHGFWQVKADKNSRNLSRLQECSRSVNEMAANVVASTKSGQEQIEDKDTMDFSGMSLIKLKKEEMETQVKVLELEKKLENERMRLGELRKQHYALAGVIDEPVEEEPPPFSRPVASPRRGILKKPPLAQKPTLVPKQDYQLQKEDGVYQARLMNS
ncbi:huntingtin-interacting protein 1-related protein-like [Dromiciops gliroides]|uniref:huntingtin-interacting protein 1-related protein-like n=1 Tax=Dromiciops gliroides TaxID=33562 RepID=UPI001CC3C5EC|nr:huntingtin-interacting protein 1-related protein-like [Dromiciops gliroides]